MPGYLVRFLDVRRRPAIASSARLETEDLITVGSASDLPLISGDRVGRIACSLINVGGKRFPPEVQPGAAITADGGTLVARYVPGMRGALAEAGVELTPLTISGWSSARALISTLPDLQTQDAIDAWLDLAEACS